MAESELVDIVILGASGFTGKYVIRELLKFVNEPYCARPRKIAIAGRCKKKLAAALTWASQDSSLTANVPIFEADVGSLESLISLCKKTKVLLSCVGPYRKFGKPVVEACVQTGVDYLDVTGEPEFMEEMEFLYHKKAMQTGSLVVSACGYISIPVEFGVIHNTQQWKPPSVPNSVDSYLLLESDGDKRITVNVGSWESMVLGVANQESLMKSRKSRPRLARPQIPGGSLEKRGRVHWEENAGGWGVRVNSADATVIRRTHATVTSNPDGLPKAGELPGSGDEKPWKAIKPVNFGCYIVQKSIFGVIRVFLIAIFLKLLSPYKWGQKLLIQYADVFSLGAFSNKGPTPEEIEAASFKTFYVARGYSDAAKVTPGMKPDKEIVTRVSGPENAYVTTPIVLIQAALIMLDDRKSLPRGGVLTPGAVFGGTDYLQRLRKQGMTFDLLSNKKI